MIPFVGGGNGQTRPGFNEPGALRFMFSGLKMYFIGVAETDDTEGDYVDSNCGREKMTALLSFCQNWSFNE